MADAQARQSTDTVNAAGVGTRFMPPGSHGQYLSGGARSGVSESGSQSEKTPDVKVGAA